MALVLRIWIRSRVCSSAEIFLNHRLNRRPVFILHRFNRCLSLRGTVSASPLEQPPTFTPMATGASDAWRMNRRFSIDSTGATVWSFGPCSVSGPYSCRCTDAHRMFRCPSNGSSGALLTTVFLSFRSGQHYTGVYTDASFSAPSELPVLRVGGPARFVFT